jgi:hypothetical protein
MGKSAMGKLAIKAIKPPVRLYHFTCHHGFAGISESGVLRPNIQPFMPHLGPLLWLTDLATPTAEDVGLTATFTSCDRLAYRYAAHTRAAMPWRELRPRVSPAVVELMERYGDPARWWIVRRPLLASEFFLCPVVEPVVEMAEMEADHGGWPMSAPYVGRGGLQRMGGL